MKVVLKKTGELKEVAVGHARNYLLPRGLAVPATPEAIQQYEALQRQHAQSQTNMQTAYDAMADQLRSLPQISIPAHANKEGTLFAALHVENICHAIANQHSIPLTTDMLTVEPIKALGTYSIGVHLPNQAECTLTIAVIADK